MGNNDQRLNMLETQVAVVEIKYENMKKEIDETKNEVKWLAKHIYIAMGGLAVIVFFIELWFNHPRG